MNHMEDEEQPFIGEPMIENIVWYTGDTGRDAIVDVRRNSGVRFAKDKLLTVVFVVVIDFASYTLDIERNSAPILTPKVLNWATFKLTKT